MITLRRLYKRVNPKKYKLNVQYDKTSKGRPAWIAIKGLPKGINFIRIHLGKKAKEGDRIIAYSTYIPEGLFLPVNHTSEEMGKFYDKFAEIYDKQIITGDKGEPGQNVLAAKFLINKVKRFIKKGEMLDLGAGTGLITEMFIKEGFGPATLIDYSEGMLQKAKKRELLENSKFIKHDIRNLNLKKKFDLILSFFSFGSSSYFKKEEMDKILNIARNHLKDNGIIAILGHTATKEFDKYFRRLDAGTYNLSTKHKFYSDYYIGGKR